MLVARCARQPYKMGRERTGGCGGRGNSLWEIRAGRTLSFLLYYLHTHVTPSAAKRVLALFFIDDLWLSCMQRY